MKKFISLFIFLACCSAYSQSLSVFDVDTTNFPIMKAKFFAFNKDGNQIRPNTSDFSITENGQPRTILNVSCPSPKPQTPLSSVLVFDVSGSMTGIPLDMEKDVANTWINMLPLGLSDCAITSFSDDNYINQDFTTNKNKLVNGINSLGIIGGTDYNAAMIDPSAGGILMAKTGKHKRIIIFLTDGQPNFEPRTQEIIDEANKNNITIYCLSINMPVHHSMIEFSNKTGGLYFENITSKEQAEDALRKIFFLAQNSNMCDIEWQSGISCIAGITNVELRITNLGLVANTSYQSPNSSVAKLEFIPISLNLKYSTPGIKKDTTITVTARNADFNISNISVSNAAFSITPSSFILKNGESKNLIVSFLPPDSGYIFCKFSIENDICPAKFYATGGFPGKKAAVRTLKLIQPNGGEVFLAGSDTIITWEGVSPNEPVTIEYRTDDNQPWIKLTDTAKGLSYKFYVPKIASDKYLARVTAKVGIGNEYCEIQICNQTWMCENLNVDTYRNGDPIPEVKDEIKWYRLTTGAWCYYNNDPANGEIYGKLYNWYAVNDPRGLAPDGYHIPTDAEWTELETCLGGYKVAGGKLKSTGTVEGGDGLWLSPNTGATNSSGFSGLPGGCRSKDGSVYIIRAGGYWWSSTENGAWYHLNYFDALLKMHYFFKDEGYSVRCVRDE
jgi:uncharacterized protein (TIGR02145 family)